MHGGMPKGNAYNVVMIEKLSNAQNTPSGTLKIDSPPEMAQAKIEMTEATINKSSTNDPSILSEQKTCVPLTVFSPAGEVRRDGAGNGEVWMQVVMVTLNTVQLHPISIQSRVILQSPRESMLSQYLYGTEILYFAHIIDDVQIQDSNGDMQLGWALIHCGATRIVMAPILSKKLGISREAARIITLALIGGVMQHAKDSQKRWITVQFSDYLAPVDELGMLVMPMWVYDLLFWVTIAP